MTSDRRETTAGPETTDAKHASVRWPDFVQEIFDGDQAVALATATSAGGVVPAPLTNFATNDRSAGTVTLNSSVGMWRKLRRIRHDPRVAIAFHTRRHSGSDAPNFVLAQGLATFGSLERPHDWIEELGERWEIFGGQPSDVPMPWKQWMDAYHWRVNITVSVVRLTIWPDTDCRAEARVLGRELPPPPAPRPEPARGTASRVDHRAAAKTAGRFPHLLLGYLDAEGFPVMVPVTGAGADEDGVQLRSETALPPGGRRAGLLGHSFSRHVVGQHQQLHTGWLVATGEHEGSYRPFTEHSYHLPARRWLYNLSAGYVTRRGLREGRRAGFLPAAPISELGK